jgi:hypothetical protein
MLHLLDLQASPASPARLTRGRRLLAIDGLRQAQGECAAAYPMWTCEQVSMP